MPVSPELRAALQRLREVRSERPRGERETESFAAWRERIADALDSLAGVLIYQEDRQRAAAEAVAARAEAERIRAELNQLG
jgi:Lon protease-like protein